MTKRGVCGQQNPSKSLKKKKRYKIVMQAIQFYIVLLFVRILKNLFFTRDFKNLKYPWLSNPLYKKQFLPGHVLWQQPYPDLYFVKLQTWNVDKE